MMPKPKIGSENEELKRVFVRFTEEDLDKINKFMKIKANGKFFESLSGLVRYTIEVCKVNKCILSEEYIQFSYKELTKKEIIMPISMYNFLESWSKTHTKENMASAIRHLTLSYIKNDNSKRGILDIKDW